MKFWYEKNVVVRIYAKGDVKIADKLVRPLIMLDVKTLEQDNAGRADKVVFWSFRLGLDLS